MNIEPIGTEPENTCNVDSDDAVTFERFVLERKRIRSLRPVTEKMAAFAQKHQFLQFYLTRNDDIRFFIHKTEANR